MGYFQGTVIFAANKNYVFHGLFGSVNKINIAAGYCLSV